MKCGLHMQPGPLESVADGGDSLERDLRHGILEGVLTPGARVPTFRELARRYGITTSKAQRVIARLATEGLLRGRRGHGTFVTDRRREAGGLPTGLSREGGAALVFLNEHSFSVLRNESPMQDGNGGVEFVRGLEDLLGAQGGVQLFRGADDVAGAFAEAHRTAAAVCAILLQCGDSTAEGLLREASCGQDQVILVEQTPEDVEWPLHLGTDSAWALREVVQLLRARGHRRLAMLSLDAEPLIQSWWVHEREAAYRTAVRAAGIDGATLLRWPAFWLSRDRGDAAARRQAIEALVADGVTGVVAVNDIVAMEVVRLAREAGLRVPGDLSVAGHDDQPATVGLGLTTVARPYRELGRLAATIVLRNRAGAPAARGRLLLRPSLVDRASVAAPQRG